jgi:hypothetical protein
MNGGDDLPLLLQCPKQLLLLLLLLMMIMMIMMAADLHLLHQCRLFLRPPLPLILLQLLLLLLAVQV